MSKRVRIVTAKHFYRWTNPFVGALVCFSLLYLPAFAQDSLDSELSEDTEKIATEAKMPPPPPKDVAKSRIVDLEWEPVEGASGYQIRFTRILKGGDKKPPITYKIKESIWSGPLHFGQYQMKLRTLDDRGVPGDWTDPMDLNIKVLPPPLVFPLANQSIKTDEEKEYETKFSWKEAPGAATYRVEISSTDGEIKESKEVDETEYSIDLPVTKSYQWKVTSIMPNGMSGEAPKAQSFRLIAKKLEKPSVDKPISKFVRKLTWSKVDRAQSYSLSLSRKLKSGKWKRVERIKQHKGNELDFNLARPTGDYRLKIRSTANNTLPSDVATLEFPVSGGLRTPAAVEQAILKDSLEKPKNLYAIASYFITVMNFGGENKETQAARNIPGTIGGTGRLGMGYQRPDSVWGGFGIIDLMGFNIGSDNFTYASMELHGTWKAYWKSNQLMLSSGLYVKELPDFQDDGGNPPQFAGAKTHSNTGLHLGFKFWRPISQKLGIQLNGRMYMPMDGESANGQSIVPMMSYQYGALGSYRLTESMMGFAGYAYRIDQGAYEAVTGGSSLANPGDVNTIKVEGHYLNLVLEYSF